MSKLLPTLVSAMILSTATSCAKHSAHHDSMPASSPTMDFVQRIESAHGSTVWRAHKAIQADISVEFGDQVYLQGTMWFDTVVGRVRMELSDGSIMVFDGEKAWISPANAERQSARFDLLTWPYFVAVPMKLSDPGTHLSIEGASVLRGKPVRAAKLTFSSGVGDSPNDWYVLYADPVTHRLVGMAYIVTFGKKDIQAAQKEPHAITYEHFRKVDGCAIATRWRFWHWDPSRRVYGEPLGRASLDNIRFIDPPPHMFVRPAHSRLSPLPGT